MKTITATVHRNPRQVNTKYGERCVVEVEMPDDSIQTIWGPVDFDPILSLRMGRQVMLGQEKNGKLHVLENSSPVAVATKPVVKESKQMYQEKNITPAIASELLIKRYAQIMARCREEVIVQMGLTEEAMVQKYATSLFIQITRQLEQF